MENKGFKNVKSLKGGILGYFEQVGGDYWDGDCFVFDRRVAVSPNLEETDHALCFACREPLDVDEQESSDYVPSVSCPTVFKKLNQASSNNLSLCSISSAVFSNTSNGINRVFKPPILINFHHWTTYSTTH